MTRTRLATPLRSLALALLACALVTSSAHADARFSEEADELASVLKLVHARLALMPAVAAYKWQHRLPVLDSAREEQLLAQTAEKAEALGLDGASVRSVFGVQMKLARALQERTIARLEARGRAGGQVLDLGKVLRPKLDRIGARLLETLARTQPSLQSSELVERYGARTRDLLAPLGVTAAEAEELLRALSQLRYGALGVKQRVLARKLLRVGTTGDYAPFSLARKSALRGVDIELTRGFARALGVELRFVRTRWSSLMPDYARGAFEIAASGISITPERSAVARFSLPYHHGGKTAIARCKDRDELDTLVELDQPSVRVVVNPGGTNEAFARAHLSHATLRVFPDNRTIFAELVAGRADVMVTDDVEVALQTKLHPELCRTTPEVFAPADKAWLVQPDPELVDAVNGWLKGEIESGRAERTLRANQ